LPPTGSRIRFTRASTFIVVAAIITLALLAYAFDNAGRFLAKEDDIGKADAIAVLAGTRMDRALEAADLYARGYAPRIVLSRPLPEKSFAVLAARGVTFQGDADRAGDALVKLGVPPGAIVLSDRTHDNTAQEAQTLRALAVTHGWHRMIVVTSKYHLRRAGFALRREFRGAGVDVQMHGTRYDDVNPDRWWTSRNDWRWVLSEGGRLVAYELGLGA
jgi:uncharacterized SAM-binding protein YcdF (DUF218 family)